MEIDEGDVERLRDVTHGFGVTLKEVVACGGVRDGGAFAGEWGEEDDLGCAGAVVLRALEVFEEVCEVGFETGEAFLAVIIPGFVEAVGGEDDVGFGFGEVVVDVAEVFGAWAATDGVRRPGEVADDEVVMGIAGVEAGFDFAEVLHAFGEGVADPDDVIALLEVERGGVGDAGEEEESEEAVKHGCLGFEVDSNGGDE